MKRKKKKKIALIELTDLFFSLSSFFGSKTGA
jgi:hypothetical protein